MNEMAAMVKVRKNNFKQNFLNQDSLKRSFLVLECKIDILRETPSMVLILSTLYFSIAEEDTHQFLFYYQQYLLHCD